MERERIAAVSRPVTRYEIEVGQDFDEFLDRYERAVPPYPAEEFGRLVERGARWDEVRALAGRVAPHHFMIYWKYDAGPIMGLAGDYFRCSEYLMGNHVIAERMFRHNPAILLYAPLRTAVTEGADGMTRFCFDRPADGFGSFGDDAITAVGAELDHKLALLLRHLSVPVPAALGATAW
ncbi:hypothetical protein Ssi03_05890 [Sphaerisporangium siamense]|uniref:DUF302 domain-containing protein n=1 Tax=Sphaerisporangium siamense TaxID=795645 RepID=A0A7W7GC29_9ACTN|nr:DUF302 domain-containing protein [Sphaerisporangium siamense]MBB4704122.1 hypothetical protein [Sphaerisporangium siamense]GII82599.1 hypothetical protein Ssi03_05890 [Sphaerisporangium siamense]